jgi:hypothetical protein
MPRACPNGHSIDPDSMSRSCPACGSLLVPPEAAAAAVARAAGELPPRDPGRVSPKAMGIGLGLLAVGIGLLAAWITLNPPVPAASPTPGPLAPSAAPSASPSGETSVRLA